MYKDDADECVVGVDHSATSLTVGLVEAIEQRDEAAICFFLRNHVFLAWETVERYKAYRDMVSQESLERIEWMVLRWYHGAREDLLRDYTNNEARLGEIFASHARVNAEKVRDHDQQEAALHRRVHSGTITWWKYVERVAALRAGYRPDDLTRRPIKGSNVPPVKLIDSD